MIYDMDEMEMVLWASQILAAKKGDKQAQQMLDLENADRQAKGLPSVEEELRALVEK